MLLVLRHGRLSRSDPRTSQRRHSASRPYAGRPGAGRLVNLGLAEPAGTSRRHALPDPRGRARAGWGSDADEVRRRRPIVGACRGNIHHTDLWRIHGRPLTAAMNRPSQVSNPIGAAPMTLMAACTSGRVVCSRFSAPGPRTGHCTRECSPMNAARTSIKVGRQWTTVHDPHCALRVSTSAWVEAFLTVACLYKKDFAKSRIRSVASETLPVQRPCWCPEAP